MYQKTGLTVLLIITAFAAKAQEVTGLWQGTLYNDSTQQHYRYEVAISDEKGKLSGFSHTWFILDKQQFYGVKKVKVRRMKGKIVVEDDGLIANNYPVPPAKHIRQLNILTYTQTDTSETLSGPFTTNRTRGYAPLTGSISLSRKRNYRQSSLVPHLEELDLDNQLSFIHQDKMKEEGASQSETASLTPKRDEGRRTVVASVRSENKIKPPATDKIISTLPAANDVSSREEVLQQSVHISGDSLLISLFDNGEVDGDTVSVLMNGSLIIPRAGLTTKATQYTINVSGLDSVKFVLYAENLGSIAPNTGLMVVRDGKELHEIRFSGNLNQNAAIIFRRKKSNTL